jgi:hypothetical protein
MLITEYFFLIACDPRSGQLAWPRREQAADQLAAAALALDLAAAERLQWNDGCLHADAGFPLNNPLLTDAMRLLAAYDLTVNEALSALARQMAPLPQRVLDALYRRDLVHRLESRDWLLRKRVRYPLRSMQARNEALQHLQSAAHQDDPHGLALLMLADMSGLLAVHLQARDHEAAMQRLLALNAVGADDPPARRVLAAIRAALLA